MSSVFTAIAIGATVVGTAVSVYGQVQAGNAAEDAAKYNNKLAEMEARNTELENMEAIKRERESNRSKLSELRNQMAGTGFLTTSGSALLLQGETAGRLELGIQDAARSANMKAASLRAEGAMGLWEGKQAKTAAYISATATGIKGIGSAAAMKSGGGGVRTAAVASS